jgi:hypothetical protein
MSVIDVIHAPDESRYEVRVDDELAGFAKYVVKGGRHLYVHTEIAERFEGQSLGSKLAKGALDDERAAGTVIVPICPFIAGWIERHPDYLDLVDEKLLARIEAGS